MKDLVGTLRCTLIKGSVPGAMLVREERLELSRVTPLEPKSSASTNSATLACVIAHYRRPLHS